MENSRKCFTCQIDKPLSDYTPNRRKYQVKQYLGMMLNCDECILDSAVKRKGCVHFNFETNKFEVHNFETDEEMLLFYDNKLSKFKR
jgi:hypothetical protein